MTGYSTVRVSVLVTDGSTEYKRVTAQESDGSNVWVKFTTVVDEW